ncbi:MAG TPA: peptidoglycan DD-metalloendopeptidase family protein [Nitrospira sp.]|nr:peptidoglycan DD-metalloendopeptidase family protein [Nitrospira sp.]
MADNLARDGRYADAMVAYDGAVERAQSAGRLVATLDPIFGALYHKAQAAALIGDTSSAIDTYRELGKQAPGNADPLFQAGLLAESDGQLDRAAEFYRSVASGSPSSRTDDPAELARRALQRLGLTGTEYFSNPRELVDLLVTALERRDIRQLERIASRTHFAIGPVGGHTAFEAPELLREFFRDLQASRVIARRGLLGTGGKLYLPTRGWRGKWFQGNVTFIITKAPQGWQWTGLAIAPANKLWLERWRPESKQSNHPLPFEILAPWPADLSFTAGGLTQFILQEAAVLATWPFGAALAFNYSRRRCGFGVRGFYYNQGWTHDEEDAFAIDFTRYRRYVPYYQESGGTPVLAVRGGIVASVQAGTPSGNSSASNTVGIVHADPANPSDLDRYRSRYLHLEGPFKIPLSTMMPIFVGNRVGRMDDTGNSILNHLHFSIHDRNIPHPNSPYGASVRPTPMSGVRLEDGDSGTCVRSTNVEYAGEKPMKELTFAGQNWLITPTATAVTNTPPGRIQDQTWLLVVSGVAIADIKGLTGAHWLHETVSIRPDLNAPLHYAINRHAIPTPTGTEGANYRLGFQVEQWAPFAALSSVYNQGQSVNSGFAVDVWRPNPFATGTDAFTNAPLNNLFSGIQVDVAVRDTDAWLYRLSYKITLLGKIVFRAIIIT